MNKSEFIREYANTMRVTLKEAEERFQAFVDTLENQLRENEYIHISGFATFEVKAKEAREGVNPKTGEKITIAACKAPAVKFSKAFKDKFNN